MSFSMECPELDGPWRRGEMRRAHFSSSTVAPGEAPVVRRCTVAGRNGSVGTVFSAFPEVVSAKRDRGRCSLPGGSLAPGSNTTVDDDTAGDANRESAAVANRVTRRTRTLHGHWSEAEHFAVLRC